MGMEARSENHKTMDRMPNFLARCEKFADSAGSDASSACWIKGEGIENVKLRRSEWIHRSLKWKHHKAPWLSIWEPWTRCRTARRWGCRWPVSCSSRQPRRGSSRWWRDSGCSAPRLTPGAGWGGRQTPFPSSAAGPTWLQVTGTRSGSRAKTGRSQPDAAFWFQF